MNELDDRLKEALGADAPAGGDIGIWAEVGEAFRGPNRWLVWLTSFWAVVFAVGMFYCGYRFFGAWAGQLGAEALVFWGVCGMFCVMANAMLKQWHWMEINKNSVLREIKRLELQVAILSERR